MFVGDFNSMDIALLLYFVGKYDVIFLMSNSFDHTEVLSFYVFKCLFLYHFSLFSHLESLHHSKIIIYFFCILFYYDSLTF